MLWDNKEYSYTRANGLFTLSSSDLLYCEDLKKLWSFFNESKSFLNETMTGKNLICIFFTEAQVQLNLKFFAKIGVIIYLGYFSNIMFLYRDFESKSWIFYLWTSYSSKTCLNWSGFNPPIRDFLYRAKKGIVSPVSNNFHILFFSESYFSRRKKNKNPFKKLDF